MGDVVPLFGVLNGASTKREMGRALAIDGRQSNILHTTTNQKQVAATKGSMEGRCNEWEVRGKHDTIVSGGR